MLLKWLEKQQGVQKQGKGRKRKMKMNAVDEEDDNVKLESSGDVLSSVDDQRMTEVVKKYWIREVKLES